MLLYFGYLLHYYLQLLRRQLDSLSDAHDDEGGVKTVLVDHYLWKYASTHPAEMGPFPFHRTITIFY